MVRVGDFTVELVEADTKEPFKEHTAPDGQVYAEVEPDMDYFISLSTDVGGVTMKLYVDGVDLGYNYFFEIANRSSILGSWSRTGGKERMTALHFNKTRQEVGAQSNNMLTGKVEVKIYALGEMVIKEMYDYVSTSLTADSMGGGKKCIKTTTNGSNSFDSTPEGQTASSKEVNYKLGEHLQTITLNYCSAFGLIYHKILPPSPDSDSDEESVPVKKERPTKRKRSTATSVSTATRVSPEGKTTLQNYNVQMVTVQKTYAVVDLTGDE